MDCSCFPVLVLTPLERHWPWPSVGVPPSSTALPPVCTDATSAWTRRCLRHRIPSCGRWSLRPLRLATIRSGTGQSWILPHLSVCSSFLGVVSVLFRLIAAGRRPTVDRRHRLVLVSRGRI